MNVYETYDDELNARLATHANKASSAIYAYMDAKLLDEDDEWAGKVWEVLSDAMASLVALVENEVENRPGMVEIGRADLAAFLASHGARERGARPSIGDDAA